MPETGALIPNVKHINMNIFFIQDLDESVITLLAFE